MKNGIIIGEAGWTLSAARVFSPSQIAVFHALTPQLESKTARQKNPHPCGKAGVMPALPPGKYGRGRSLGNAQAVFCTRDRPSRLRAHDQRPMTIQPGPGVFGARPPAGPLCERADVLSFATPPLLADLEMIGPLELRLWLACEAPDADIHAKLVDVHPPNEDDPDGFAINLSEGVLRLRYRHSWERPSLMIPGEVYAVTIGLFPTANLFQRGHRLRLDLAGSNFPHFDINSNSGEPEGSARHPRTAHSRIFVDRSCPSHLILPVIPKT